MDVGRSALTVMIRAVPSWTLTPISFQPILSFLRSCAINSNPDTRPDFVGVDGTKQQALTDLIKYLGLEEYLGYPFDIPLQPQLYTFAKASAEVILPANRQKATVSNDSQDHQIILVCASCNPCSYVKIRINNLVDQMFLGVTADADVFGGEAQVAHPTSHGWTSGRGVTRHTSKGLTVASCTVHENVFSSGCWVLMKADFTSQKLSMRTSMTDLLYSMRLTVAGDPTSKYSFMVTLPNPGDEVELVQVTYKDKTLLF